MYKIKPWIPVSIRKQELWKKYVSRKNFLDTRFNGTFYQEKPVYDNMLIGNSFILPMEIGKNEDISFIAQNIQECYLRIIYPEHSLDGAYNMHF